VVKDGKLYGRGSHDDGYALFSAILSVKALQACGKSHPKIIITIEGSEEGEIFDLVHYLKKHKALLEDPKLVICLDAGAQTSDSLTVTTSLRGIVTLDVKATILANNLHSGMAGGIYPNPFTILTNLQSKIVNPATQKELPEL